MSSSTTSSSALKKRTNFSEFCWFLFPDTTPALIVAASNARDANYPTMSNFSASMSSITPPANSANKKKLISNSIGVRMRKTSRNCSTKLRKKMIAASPRLTEVLLVPSKESPSMTVWNCLRKRRLWPRIMLGTVPNARTSFWPRKKWRSTKHPKS